MALSDQRRESQALAAKLEESRSTVRQLRQQLSALHPLLEATMEKTQELLEKVPGDVGVVHGSSSFCSENSCRTVSAET